MWVEIRRVREGTQVLELNPFLHNVTSVSSVAFLKAETVEAFGLSVFKLSL